MIAKKTKKNSDSAYIVYLIRYIYIDNLAENDQKYENIIMEAKTHKSN